MTLKMLKSPQKCKINNLDIKWWQKRCKNTPKLTYDGHNERCSVCEDVHSPEETQIKTSKERSEVEQ